MIEDVLVTKLVCASGTRDNRQGTVITVNETDTLKGLIEKARRERGASARQLAKQAQDAEFKIVGTTLNAIESGTYKSRPSDETIRAIGWLAGVSDDVAFTAAGRRNPGPPFASELPPGVDDLSPTERRTALAVLRTLVAQRQEINRYEDTSTQTSTTRDPEAGSSARIGASIVDESGEQETPQPVIFDEVRAAAQRKAAALNRSNQGDNVDGRLPKPKPEDFLAAQTIDPKDASLRPSEPDDESQDRGSDDPV